MKTGDLVLSVAGRDKGRYGIVVAVSEPYCLVCDGRVHKSEKPKKKKTKHVIMTGVKSELTDEVLSENGVVTNTMLKREISKLKALLEPSELPME